MTIFLKNMEIIICPDDRVIPPTSFFPFKNINSKHQMERRNES